MLKIFLAGCCCFIKDIHRPHVSVMAEAVKR